MIYDARYRINPVTGDKVRLCLNRKCTRSAIPTQALCISCRQLVIFKHGGGGEYLQKLNDPFAKD